MSLQLPKFITDLLGYTKQIGRSRRNRRSRSSGIELAISSGNLRDGKRRK
jgi:hypothetical protein